MRRVALLLGLCACNQVHGLDPTQLPPPDAPHACPELGRGAPAFSRVIHPATTQPSSSYHFTPTGTLAVAQSGDAIFTGRLGEPLTRVDEIMPDGEYMYLDPHPSPDGERLYIQSTFGPLVTAAAGQNGIEVYERTNGAWRSVGYLPANVPAGMLSTVFRGPAGDRIIFTGESTLEELEHVDGTWMHKRTHDGVALQIAGGAQLALTSDGLRAVYRGTTQMLYTDRMDLDSPFRAPVALAGVPKVMDAQLTDDCARIYYSGLNAVFYSQQE